MTPASPSGLHLRGGFPNCGDVCHTATQTHWGTSRHLEVTVALSVEKQPFNISGVVALQLHTRAPVTSEAFDCILLASHSLRSKVLCMPFFVKAFSHRVTGFFQG